MVLAPVSKGFQELTPEEPVLDGEVRIALGGLVKRAMTFQRGDAKFMGEETGPPSDVSQLLLSAVESGKASTITDGFEDLDTGDIVGLSGDLEEFAADKSKFSGLEPDQRRSVFGFLRDVNEAVLRRVGREADFSHIHSSEVKGIIVRNDDWLFLENDYREATDEPDSWSPPKRLAREFLGKDGLRLADAKEEVTKTLGEHYLNRMGENPNPVTYREQKLLYENIGSVVEEYSGKCERATEIWKASGKSEDFLQAFDNLKEVLVAEPFRTTVFNRQDTLSEYKMVGANLMHGLVMEDNASENDLAKALMIINEGIRMDKPSAVIARSLIGTSGQGPLMKCQGHVEDSDVSASLDNILESDSSTILFVDMARAYQTQKAA